jgi:hypothetical protein
MAESIIAMEDDRLADHTTPVDEVRADQAEQNALVFGGETRNMAMGIAMLGAGAGAFVLGLTDTFFGQAIAVTFALWGLLLLYNDLLLSTRRFTITDEGLKIDVPMRLWNRSRLWAWNDINRLDIVTYRRDVDTKNAMIQVHHRYPEDIALEREDRNFDPELAYLIIDRAKLKPDQTATGVDLGNLATGQDATYTWKK